MQFQLRLQCLEQSSGRNPVLPFNYPYRLSGWLYGLLREVDHEYAAFLHEQGYRLAGTESNRGKTFKLFTFSDLRPHRYAISPQRGGIELLSPEVDWTIGFYVEKAAETFITGLFAKQTCRITGRGQDLLFRVAQVAAVPVTLSTDTVQLRTLSPLVVAEKQPNGNDRYLSPEAPQYGTLLIGNLIDKFRSVHPEVVPADKSQFSYQLLPRKKPPRSRLLTIKEGSRQQTQIRGYYDFAFALSGPKEYLEVGLYAGLGRYNAEGCGCVELHPKE